jgi:hypothetical protein
LSKAVLFAGCALALLAGACSGKNTSTSSGAAVPLGQFATQFGTTYCDMLEPCCSSASLAYDPAIYKQTAITYFQDYATENSSKTYDAAAAGRCLGAVEDALRNCGKFEDDTTGVACASIFVGTVALGGACKDETDCANGASCAANPNDPSGGDVCRAQPGTTHAKAGEACSADCVSLNGVTECGSSGSPSGGSAGPAGICYAADGLHCSSQTQVCTALAQLGQACEPEGCVTGAFCDAGSCAAQRDSGSCSAAPDACSAKSYCDFTSDQCTAKKAAGAVCNQSGDCLSDECTGDGSLAQATCAASGAATAKTCAGNLN